MYQAKLRIKREDVNHLAKCLEDLDIKGRARGELEVKDGELEIVVKARDANAFRAALNNYLRLLQTTENIRKEVIEWELKKK